MRYGLSSRKEEKEDDRCNVKQSNRGYVDCRTIK